MELTRKLGNIRHPGRQQRKILKLMLTLTTLLLAETVVAFQVSDARVKVKKPQTQPEKRSNAVKVLKAKSASDSLPIRTVCSRLFSSSSKEAFGVEGEQESRQEEEEECNDIVILGGGFGGLNTALTLDALPWAQYQKGGNENRDQQRPKIKLIDNKERFIFLPLLYELCVGDAELEEVAPTFDSLLQNNPNIEFIQRNIQGVDIEQNKVYLTKTNKDRSPTDAKSHVSECVSYKSLILATGASINLSSIEGASKYALPFYTVQDCYELRKQLNILDIYIQQKQLQQKEQAYNQGTEGTISIVIVGGGYSGVELALNLKERLSEKQKKQPTTKTTNKRSTNDINVILLHRGDEVLQYATEYNRKNGQQRLLDAGVEIRTNQNVIEVLPPQQLEEDNIYKRKNMKTTTEALKYKCQVVTNESTINADLLIWTAGAMAKNEQRDILNSKLPRDSKGRIVTNPYLQVPNVPNQNVYALGDCSRSKKVPYAATAAVAMQQAPVVAWNVFASTSKENLLSETDGQLNNISTKMIKELDPLPFEYIDLGSMMTLGGDDATISSLNGAFQIDGSIASIARRLIYAARMPTIQQVLTAAVSSTNKRLEKGSLSKVNKIINWK